MPDQITEMIATLQRLEQLPVRYEIDTHLVRRLHALRLNH